MNMFLTILQHMHTLGANCSNSFFLLPTWYKYLQLDPGTCEVVNFQVPGDFLLVGLAILDIATRLVGLISVGYVIYGGILYITSSGAPDKAKAALDTIINAFIGIVIALLAAAIVSFVGNRFG